MTKEKWIGLDDFARDNPELATGKCDCCGRTAVLGTVKVSGRLDGERVSWTERACSEECAKTYATK